MLIDAARRAPEAPVFLRYAGVTAATTPSARNQADLLRTGSFWSNLTAVLELTPKVFSLKGAHSNKTTTYAAGIRVPVSAAEHRARIDLQDIERALVAAVFPLCGNSAPGGLHHQPDLSPYEAVPLPRFDVEDDKTAERLRALNLQINQHHDDARKIWSSVSRKGISDAAAEDARRNAQVTELVQGGVGIDSYGSVLHYKGMEQFARSLIRPS